LVTPTNQSVGGCSLHTHTCSLSPSDMQKYPSGTPPEPRNLAYGRLATPTRIRSTRHRLTANAMGLELTTTRCISTEDQLLGELKGQREERAAHYSLSDVRQSTGVTHAYGGTPTG